MVDYMITFAAGAAAGVFLEKFVFAKMQESGIQNRTDALRACFGEPVSATKFTFTEVKEWIRARKDQIVDDAKAAVVKVDENTMKSLGKDLDTRGVENYIVLVIMTGDKQIADSLLVKYEKLDQKLEDALAKGNGILVVKG
ncbi:MAG: hypothetical protein HDT27_11045 [Subdoligranulum sp.]|nr:hypothetical protein [Subdoligranulum sp.]